MSSKFELVFGILSMMF